MHELEEEKDKLDETRLAVLWKEMLTMALWSIFGFSQSPNVILIVYLSFAGATQLTSPCSRI
jgi:hypothetical protein